MQLLLLSFLLLSFGGMTTAATKKEDIVRQYYHSAQKGDFVIAQKVLESCKECNHIAIMQEALAQAKSQKDVNGTAWISSELTLAEQNFMQRNSDICIAFVGIACLVAGYYTGQYVLTQRLKDIGIDFVVD